MGQQERQIEIRETELGPVIARADHRDGAIEVNSQIFYGLPPMVQEFVLCHEVCHLLYDDHDEARTNKRATRLFIDRSADAADRAKRERFVSYMSGQDYSNFAWAELVTAVVGLASTVYGVIANRNAGWYKWDAATRRANLDVMLTQAFEQSRRSMSMSASDLFWEQMRNYTGKDDSIDGFLSRTENAWVSQVIKTYEKKYGFGFSDVTPIDLSAFPAAMLALGLLVGYAVYLLIKKIRK